MMPARRTARFTSITSLRSTRRTASSFCACRCRRSSREFISLTNALPAVNWQEREIQDLFGLKLEGHPNPRRCALHDDWPEVYPLRKDFDLHTVLPPFTGRAAQVPRGGRRRRVSGAGGAGACGHHRAGPFPFQRGRRAGALPPNPALLHAQGHGEAVREHPRDPRRPAGGEHLRRFQLRARDRLLPRRRAGRQRRSAAARRARCARSASNWSASTTTSRTSARLRPTWPSSWPTPTPCGSRSACCG